MLLNFLTVQVYRTLKAAGFQICKVDPARFEIGPTARSLSKGSKCAMDKNIQATYRYPVYCSWNLRRRKSPFRLPEIVNKEPTLSIIKPVSYVIFPSGQLTGIIHDDGALVKRE